LVIEDEEYARECMCDFLELVGFSCVRAANGREGIELFGRHEPDLIVTDIRMPEMDGFDILKFLQSYSSETPVIVISGTNSLDDVAQCLKLGAWDYIVKPVYDYGVVEMSILRVLEKKQLIEENRRYREYLEEEVIKRSDELLSSTVRFKTLFNLAGDILFIHDGGGKIIDCNETAFRHMGYGRKRMLEMNMRDLIVAEDAALFEQVMARLPRKSSIMYELRCALHSGAVSTMELHATMITTEAQPIVFAICRDITERRRLEQEREELKRQIVATQKMELVGLLASGIAHDFNNVLTALTGYVTLLQMDVSKSGGSAAEYADKIAAVAAKGQALAGRLMSFIRKKRDELVPVDIHGALREAETLLRPNCKGVRITLELGAENSVVLGDDSQIQNVFLNLGLNARDAMPGGGEIVFRTYNEGGCGGRGLERKGCGFIGIDVADNGTGIDGEIIGKIFDPLFTTKPQGEGTGIGLPGVQFCVKNLNGSIGVSSEVGRGTTFKVLLPLHAGAAREADLSGLRVVVVAEGGEAAEALCGRLARAGAQVRRIGDAEAALNEMRGGAGETAAVIVDYDAHALDESALSEGIAEAAPDALVVKILSRDRVALGSNRGCAALANAPIDGDAFAESLAACIRGCASGCRVGGGGC
jgi:PAS domain S-box-containing protein